MSLNHVSTSSQSQEKAPKRRPAAPRLGRTAEDRLKLLSEIPLFKGLETEALRPLAEACSVVRFRPGELIVRQGDPGESVFAIVRGRVEVRVATGKRDPVPGVWPPAHTPDEPEAEVVVSWMVPGDTVGELALLDGRPRSASCVAMTPTVCLSLSREDFRAALQHHWSLTDALLQVCAQRLRTADELIAAQARDPLTGVNNRGTLEELYKREAARTKRARQQEDAARLRPLGVVFADVDRFKTINDVHGHHVGDLVLRSVATTLTRVGRETDMVARYGGDEFVMLLPDAGEEGTEVVAGRIRETLTRTPPGPVPFTVSVGTAVVDPSRPPPLETVLEQADRAMYEDKARLVHAN